MTSCLCYVKVQAKQAVYTVQGEADVIAIASQAGMTCVNVLTVRGGRVLGGKNYFPDVDSSEPLADNLSAFITSFYFQVTDDLPAEIILSHELPDQVAVSEALATPILVARSSLKPMYVNIAQNGWTWQN